MGRGQRKLARYTFVCAREYAGGVAWGEAGWRHVQGETGIGEGVGGVGRAGGGGERPDSVVKDYLPFWEWLEEDPEEDWVMQLERVHNWRTVLGTGAERGVRRLARAVGAAEERRAADERLAELVAKMERAAAAREAAECGRWY